MEITYGLERLEMFLEQKDNIYNLEWSDDVTYHHLRFREEKEFSIYNFEQADTNMLRSCFTAAEKEAQRLISQQLLLPAYDYCLNARICLICLMPGKRSV